MTHVLDAFDRPRQASAAIDGAQRLVAILVLGEIGLGPGAF